MKHTTYDYIAATDRELYSANERKIIELRKSGKYKNFMAMCQKAGEQCISLADKDGIPIDTAYMDNYKTFLEAIINE